MAKALRELVELFGQSSYGDNFEEDEFWGGNDYDEPLDALRGPFYSGMNYQMNVGSFAMRLNSPSSTSKTFAVALKFSGPTGTIFTFDNAQYEYLRSFACSHISRFKEEDECLFFGGFYRIKVVNVRLMATKENMQLFVAAIFQFDKALNGGSFAKKTKNGFLIIDALIKAKSQKKQTKKVILPQYILDCFHSFCANKQQIILDLYELNKYGDESVNQIFVHALDERAWNNVFQRSNDDLRNVVRSDLFSLFPNVSSLIIDTYEGFEYSLSLLALLNVIVGTNLSEIIIKCKETLSGYCWTKSVWNSNKESLKNEYGAKGYDIEMNVDGKQHNLRINKV